MPETVIEAGPAIEPVRDLDSAAAFFERATPGPANDSTVVEGEVTTDPENPDPENPDPENPEGKVAGGGNDDDDPTKEPEFKEQPEWSRKRMGEISEKKNLLAAENETLKTDAAAKADRIAELEKQVAGKAPVIVAPTASSPLAHVEDPQSLQRELDDALNAREWAMRNPEGGTMQLSDGKTREVSAEEVREGLVNADRMINQHIPKRMEFLRGRQQYITIAQEKYPDVLKAGTDDHSLYQTLLSHWPEIKRFQDPEIIAGRYIRGLRAEEAEAAAKKAGKGPVAPVKKPAAVIAPTAPKAGGGAMPAGGDKGKDAEVAEVRKQATKTGGLDATARFFDAAERRR